MTRYLGCDPSLSTVPSQLRAPSAPGERGSERPQSGHVLPRHERRVWGSLCSEGGLSPDQRAWFPPRDTCSHIISSRRRASHSNQQRHSLMDPISTPLNPQRWNTYTCRVCTVCACLHASACAECVNVWLVHSAVLEGCAVVESASTFL